MSDNKPPQVFCIGLPRTGTTSMGWALSKLGYTVAGPFGMDDVGWDHESVLERAEFKLETCNAVQDTPWPVLYEWLDMCYPDAKFILTYRGVDDWIRSMKDRFREPLGCFSYMFNEPLVEGNEEHFLRKYRQHNMAVSGWFADRPDKLLSFHIGEHNWSYLCKFLGIPSKDTPKGRFPHLNKADR